MSKVSIQGDVSGTGDFTIKAPNSNVDRTLNLPDEAGTVLTDVSDLEPQVKDSLNATGSAPVYACRAWVNFDGTNTTIRDSGNVSSITDNATGDFTVNLSTAIDNQDFSIVGQSHNSESSAFSQAHTLGAYATDTSTIQVYTYRVDSSGGLNSGEFVNIAVFH